MKLNWIIENAIEKIEYKCHWKKSFEIKFKKTLIYKYNLKTCN